MISPEAIARSAVDAFPSEPVPPRELLYRSHCDECIDVSNAYGVRPWTAVALDDMVGKETALLSAAAWRYFLPAMITWCVREPDALDTLPDFLVYQLEPPEVGTDEGWFLERKGGFSDAQRAVIVAYLEWYREREEIEYAALEMEVPRHVYRALEHWRGVQE
ncbi:MAG: DUF6714 family protein [Vicinamibacteria bacterium]